MTPRRPFRGKVSHFENETNSYVTESRNGEWEWEQKWVIKNEKFFIFVVVVVVLGSL